MNLALGSLSISPYKMKRFVVVTRDASGATTTHPMKGWLRDYPAHLPAGCDATTSTSHQLRNGLKRAGWTVQENDFEVRLLPPGEVGRDTGFPLEEDVPDEAGPSAYFALEHQLRDFLAENIATVPVDGRRLKLYVSPEGHDGIEYSTDVGFIDILATDENGDFVVFELKRARTADRAIGQLTRYMGWVKHTIGRDRRVSGVIVAREIDQRLRYAASVIPDVALLEYVVDFKLSPANHLP